MNEKGEVLRQYVIEVLRSKGVTATLTSPDEAAESVTYTLQKGDIIESQTFPNQVGRKMLHYLQRHFDVPIHLFFTLETITAKPAIVKPQKTA